ncbi:phospholipase D [Tieghemostelium lacteum]|uniref:Phospholipase D n=1 Tax=Tieghemostelium lacteum TaxID=361077 RepID=A0A151ZK22_TIELA|nr:phospholipase D [Tieghemostelium lacteum]|eukprot:KYQ94296.1 phospholipase D [Tieghemostelium lacteum]
MFRGSNAQIIKSIFKNKKTLDQLRLNLKNTSIWEKIAKSWQKTSTKLSSLGSHSHGNSVTIFNSGDEAFQAMWDSIENAKESILLETYTIEMDDIGRKTIDLLSEAKNRGCNVRFVYDGIGSSSVTDDDLFRLNMLGGSTYKFNPVSLFGRMPFVFRNHRKIMVVDNKIGFCGGMNISAKYATSKIGGSDYFRDTHVMIEGPAVLDLHRVFHNSMKDNRVILTGGKTYDSYSPALAAACPFGMTPLDHLYNSVGNLQYHLYQSEMNSPLFKLDDGHFLFFNELDLFKKKKKCEVVPQHQYTQLGKGSTQIEPVLQQDEFDTDEFETEEYDDHTEDFEEDEEEDQHKLEDNTSFVQVQESNLFRNKKSIQKAMIMTLKSSKSHCYFTTPYFLPPKKLRDAMIEASERGVDVRVLTAGISDVPWIRLASRHIYNKFLSKSVKIYEFNGNRLHSKTVTIDGIYSSVGSYNLDPWSQRNLEVNLSFINSNVAKQLEDQFENDLKESTEITTETIQNLSLLNKFICYLAYQFSRIVRPISTFK